MEVKNYFDELSDITGEELQFKNALVYDSSDWRAFKDLTVSLPVQRRLTAGECIFDLDGISTFKLNAIIAWFDDQGLIFSAWRSSETGAHIHFFTDIYGKERKKELVTYMSKRLEEKWGISTDIAPMGHGVIRAEFSYHPIKQTQKVLIFSNIRAFRAINIIPSEIKAHLDTVPDAPIKGRSGEREGKAPKCIKLILNNSFNDGRKRLLFAVVSWFKGSGLSDDEIFEKSREWADRQGCDVSTRQIRATIASSSGLVGCRYRHALLEEMGFDHNCNGKYE